MKKYFINFGSENMIFNKIIAFLIIISFFLLINQTVSSETTDQTVIYISNSGSGNFSKIQDGIDAANTGDTIYVYNGTYYENIVIDTSIKLIGENRYNTIIDGRGVGNVIKINADNVKIQGFTIQHSGLIYPLSGINLTSKKNVIKDNTIKNSFYGMTLYYSNENTIMGNTIQDNDHCGIYMSQSSYNNILHNIILDHTYNGVGVYDSSDDNLIEGNDLINNVYCGVNIRLSSDNDVIGNNFTDNHIGIHLPRTKNNVKDNYFSNNDIDIEEEFFLTESERYIIFFIISVMFIVGIFIYWRRRQNKKEN